MGRMLMCIFIRSLLLLSALTFVAHPLEARSLRAFMIPQASTPEARDCRFEFENRFTSQRKADDRGGEFFEYGAGYGCHLLTFGEVDLEAGFDYIEAHDIRATNVLAPLQGNLRVTYGARSEKSGWAAAIGVDSIGLAAGENSFNVGYLLGQHQVELWRIVLGGYAGNSGVLRTGDDKPEPSGAMLGVWRTIGRGLVGLEWQSGQNRLGFTTFGAEIRFDERLTAALAYAIANDRDLMRDWVLIRLQLR